MMKAFEFTCGCIIVALEAFDKWLFSDRFYSFLLGLDVGLALFAAFIWGCCL